MVAMNAGESATLWAFTEAIPRAGIEAMFQDSAS